MTRLSEKIYTDLKRQAQVKVGGAQAFELVGPAIRRAFVAQEILGRMVAQDASISADKTLTVTETLYGHMTSDKDLV